MPETQDEQAAILKNWEAWFSQLGPTLVDAGNPFSSEAKSIASDGMVSDGPVSEMASGYSVIMTNTLDEAVDMAKGCPVLKGSAQVSAYKTFNAMWM